METDGGKPSFRGKPVQSGVGEMERQLFHVEQFDRAARKEGKNVGLPTFSR
jgi:hypothetical protein